MQYHVLSSVHLDHIRAVARELGPDWYYHHISSHARYDRNSPCLAGGNRGQK